MGIGGSGDSMGRGGRGVGRSREGGVGGVCIGVYREEGVEDEGREVVRECEY